MIYLSPPEVIPSDSASLLSALEGGWIAPAGPELDAFEHELARATDRQFAVALASGTAALHLALLAARISPGDRVICSTLTFAATANAIRYVGAVPVFVDSDRETWNMDPELLDAALSENRSTAGAVVAVDLYGQCASYREIERRCRDYELFLIEDAAEALGAESNNRPAGSFGHAAILSFNGNKIITTGGGGALVTDDAGWANEARFLATQARDPAPHYQHSRLGYNYRLSNLSAALGRSQLADLHRRVALRRGHNLAYRDGLADLPGLAFMPEAVGDRSTFWLTAITIEPDISGIDRERLREHLAAQNIEARPVWKPMHLQPLYQECRVFGGDVSSHLFEVGLCLPSGSSLSESQRSMIIALIRELWRR